MSETIAGGLLDEITRGRGKDSCSDTWSLEPNTSGINNNRVDITIQHKRVMYVTGTCIRYVITIGYSV